MSNGTTMERHWHELGCFVMAVPHTLSFRHIKYTLFYILRLYILTNELHYTIMHVV